MHMGPLDDLRAISRYMKNSPAGCWIDHVREKSASAFIADGLHRNIDVANFGRPLLAHLTSEIQFALPNTRLLMAVAHLQRTTGEAASLDDVARESGLSPSRLRHLMKEQTGVSFRRIRLWLRMHAAIHFVESGATMTQAALDAGFSSSAHFSSTFRKLFGLAPSSYFSRKLGSRPRNAGAK
jgi:AraC-like DNA-binding protein